MRAALIALTVLPAFAAPVVIKVEPPNWWTRTTLNPVRLLVRGTGLTGAHVSSDLPVSRVSINNSGTYLFADVTIPESISAGNHPLTIRTANGTTTAPFTLLQPLAPENRFSGYDARDIIYLAMPDRFSNGDPANDDPTNSRGLFDPAKSRYYHGGDFKGISEHLPYLKELGITALWLNPWYDNVNHLNEREMPEGQPITDYHGYGAVDFYGVEEHFGSLDDLRDLVDRAHALGIKVIQDEVANHTGPYHPWVTNSPTPTWFHGTAARHIKETWQLWPLIDPHAGEALRAETLDGWFADILPDLNQDDPECARYLIQNTLWWIGITGLDAIRMDTLPYVPRAFWKDWMAAIGREYPHVNVVGEVFDADPAIPSSFQTGNLNVFDFPNYFKAREVFARGKASVRDLAGMLGHDGMYQNPSLLSTFIGNHDVMRFMSEDGATAERLKLAFTWLLTTRGVPVIYYGDEVAMRGGGDPDNRRDFPQSAFTALGRSAEQQDVWQHVQQMIHLRTSLPALTDGNTRNECIAEQQWVWSRSKGDQTVYVEINNADQAASLDCKIPSATRTVFGMGAYGDQLAPHSARISVKGS